ncbi:MAG: aldehyde dehydrogenase (NADP(+)), partial [Mycobacteriales bacterium]
RLLRAVADALAADAGPIVALADRETALGSPRLPGELTRTTYQLRLFADALEEGSYLEVTIEHAADTAMGPRPNLRRWLVPVGPVGVFGSSNFPLAFSVPGGDTAAALASGCPVVVKAHPGHPATAQRCFERIREAAANAGAPDGTIGIVHGEAAGAAVVQHPAIRAVGFTGSLRGGRALADLAAGRPDPIPFYAELGSINPLVVTPAAAARRAGEIGTGLAASYTLGVGQFCTKPGLAFVPAGADGDAVVDALAAATRAAAPGVLLTAGVRDGFARGSEDFAGAAAVTEVARGDQPPPELGYAVRPRVLQVDAGELHGRLQEECFGPLVLVVRYTDEAALLSALGRVPGSLTASLHIGPGETDLPQRVLDVVTAVSGRVVFDGFPTGVAVAWAMQHGGPWPASTSIHTSVGITAMRRFLRPVCLQDAPVELLPGELRDDNPDRVPQRVDGVLRLP